MEWHNEAWMSFTTGCQRQDGEGVEDSQTERNLHTGPTSFTASTAFDDVAQFWRL
ncbi:unnamed protein product [Taenia asiatica]|uniref:Uncharacterized protein n=1 Tax=Taenia asiatica TaxID=60517 RepID=A0A0R3VZ86_TAEAS|nr:unnamed protein product [Taenia asiatica]